MGTKLSYPPLPDGYRWNLLSKINYKIGKWPGTETNTRETKLEFIEDLTPQEIIDVEAIMADPNTAQSPIVFEILNNTFILKDVQEWRAELEAAAGYEIAITYRSSGLQGTALDEIVLQPTDPTYQAVRILSNPQKNALVGAVEDLGRWE
jgi:hypothetical protein